MVSERVGQLELSIEGEVDICQSGQMGKGIWVEREAVHFRRLWNVSETPFKLGHTAMMFNLDIFASPCMPDGTLSITWARLS